METLLLRFMMRLSLRQLFRSWTTFVSATIAPLKILWSTRGTLVPHGYTPYSFTTFLYVPEVDPIPGDVFHEREDHCHILKRIWKHKREGGPTLSMLHLLMLHWLESTTSLSQMQRGWSPIWLQSSFERMGMPWGILCGNASLIKLVLSKRTQRRTFHLALSTTAFSC